MTSSVGKRVMERLKGGLKALSSLEARASSAKPRRRRQVWSIGIYVGESPLNLVSPRETVNPVLTREEVSDAPAAFVADPFMLRVAHAWHMFFEVMDRRSRKGVIGLATSENGMKWKYRQIVLSEPFHLSYPYVFEWMNDHYMVPETGDAGCIRLYKAAEFPRQWTLVGTLLNGDRFRDPSIFRYDGRWWLFVETSSGMDDRHDTLRLYHANDLTGPWLEHRKSPVVKGDPHIARPAGRVLVLNGRVIRYAQDCYPTYGTGVRAFEITDLTPARYHEQGVLRRPVLSASGAGWNAGGMHHVDPHPIDGEGWMACVDGWAYVEE